MSNQTHQTLQAISTTAELEVMGVLGTEFLALEELAPGQDWDDLLAASWGIPTPTAATASAASQSGRFAFVKPLIQACWQICLGRTSVA